MRPSRAVTLLLVALALLQLVHYWPLLPEVMATHFDASGQADGWSSKSSFLITNLLFTLGMAALFLALPLLLNKIPNEWINMPNKEYWLAPERREETLATMQIWMEWIGAATVALLIAITQMTIEANLSGAQDLGQGFAALMTGYLVVMAVWIVGFLRWAFKKPPSEATP